jgi:disulfide bond formation protein DsbB
MNNKLTDIVRQINNISQSQWYWFFYIAGGLSSLAAALYFQHGREELPCLMCIQVRLLISLLVIVSVAGLLFRGNRVMSAITHLLVVILAISLTERSYQLLGTERGFVFSDCGFDLGLPAWFAIEDWLPWLYRVETACGYTPEIAFGITMAEVLIVMSAALLVLALSVLMASLIHLKSPE